MDDFELFRARSMHGGVLGTEQSPLEHRERKCKFASKSKASEAPGNCSDRAKVSDCKTHTSKFWARCDDVMAIPEVVRCSNAWVDFSTELPVRNKDRDQKPDSCHRPRNAWMRQSKPSAVGFSLPDQSATHEFDVYRLRSFATADGRIVNRGDYFRVRQRVHPTEAEQSEQFRGPTQTVSENSAEVAESPSNSKCSSSSTIEYRPIVYYATKDCDVADDDETGDDDHEGDFSDEKTRLLADPARQTTYFSRMKDRSRYGEEKKGSYTGLSSRGRYDDGGNIREPSSTNVPDSDMEQFRVTSVIRVVVLGDRGVGKTTLARQLLTSEHLATRSACFNFTQGKTMLSCHPHLLFLNRN